MGQSAPVRRSCSVLIQKELYTAESRRENFGKANFNICIIEDMANYKVMISRRLRLSRTRLCDLGIYSAYVVKEICAVNLIAFFCKITEIIDLGRYFG